MSGDVLDLLCGHFAKLCERSAEFRERVDAYLLDKMTDVDPTGELFDCLSRLREQLRRIAQSKEQT